MYLHNDDTETSLRDFRIKLIELTVITIAAFSLVLLSTEQSKVKFLLAGFAALIVFQVVGLAHGANRIRQQRVLKKGNLEEDVKLTYYSYTLTWWDYISLSWYGITLLASVLIIINA